MEIWTTITFLLLLNFSTSAQNFPVDAATGFISYADTVRVDSASAKKLYSRAKAYFVENYKSAKDVIQLDDTSKIISKAYTDVYFDYKLPFAAPVASKLFYTLKIQFKENKYRYELTNLYVQNYTTPQNFKVIQTPLEDIFIKTVASKLSDKQQKVRQGMMIETQSKIQSTINQLKKAMLKTDEW